MSKGYDIRDVFDYYNVDYRDNGFGNIEFICPFHADTNFGNANWSEDKAIYKCFACGAGGNIFRFVVDMEGGEDVCTFRHAEKLIASGFTYTGEYDVNVLTKMLEQFKHKQVRYKNEIVDKCINNILRSLSERTPDILMFTKWLRIITYIQHYASTVLSKQDIMEIVNIYTEFYKELNENVVPG